MRKVIYFSDRYRVEHNFSCRDRSLPFANESSMKVTVLLQLNLVCNKLWHV